MRFNWITSENCGRSGGNRKSRRGAATPGLHDEERQAISDALRPLRALEQEDQREAAEAALEKLNSLAPAVERLHPDSETA
jgi:predicted DNA-binding transcriptional regulator YafY